MPPKYSRPIKLDGIEDLKLPRQIAEELAKRNDVLEVVYFPPAQAKIKGQYRIKLKSSDEFNIFMFKLLYNSRAWYQFIFSQSKSSSNMTEVVIAEDDGTGSMDSNDEKSVRSLWKFCNSITLPKSEVVFFS